MSYLRSFAFCNGGPDLVFDSSSLQFEEPRADERERAMGFLTGTTSGPDLTEAQRRQCLGQAMDLTSMVWFIGVCLAAQRHNTLGFGGHLGAEASSQGAESVVPSNVEKIAFPDVKVWHNNKQVWHKDLEKRRVQEAIEWRVADDLRGQRVFAALAQDFNMEDAKEKFKQVLCARENLYQAHAGLVGMIGNKNASIALDKGNGAHSSN